MMERIIHMCITYVILCGAKTLARAAAAADNTSCSALTLIVRIISKLAARTIVPRLRERYINGIALALVEEEVEFNLQRYTRWACRKENHTRALFARAD